MDPNKQVLEEMLRLTKDNNHMLHAMRRHAFWGGVLKFAIWTGFILIPIWFYMTYLNDTVHTMLRTVDQMQTTGANAQAKIGSLEQAWKDIESKLPSFMHASSTGQ